MAEHLWVGNRDQVLSAIEQVETSLEDMNRRRDAEPDAPVLFEAHLLEQSLRIYLTYLEWSKHIQYEAPDFEVLGPDTPYMPSEEQILTKVARPGGIDAIWDDRPQFLETLAETITCVTIIANQLEPDPAGFHPPITTRGQDQSRDIAGPLVVQELKSRSFALGSTFSAYKDQRQNSREREEARAAELAQQQADLDAAMSAQKQLSKKFNGEADAETNRANTFRLLVVVTVGAFAVFAAYSSTMAAAADWQTLASHLAISVPAFVLAGYFAREAAQHRRLARWLRVLAVQLETAEDYVRPLDQSDRSTLLLALGQRVFGPLPDLSNAGSDDGDLTTALGIIERLADRR